MKSGWRPLDDLRIFGEFGKGPLAFPYLQKQRNDP
jgi:hypothetical protein